MYQVYVFYDNHDLSVASHTVLFLLTGTEYELRMTNTVLPYGTHGGADGGGENRSCESVQEGTYLFVRTYEHSMYIICCLMHGKYVHELTVHYYLLLLLVRR